MASFAVHATRGLIRDQTARRKAMFMSLVVALVLLFVGSTFLQPFLVAHPIWFIVFWFGCAWLTLLAVLLALFDLLMLRVQTRTRRKSLGTELSSAAPADSASERDQE